MCHQLPPNVVRSYLQNGMCRYIVVPVCQSLNYPSRCNTFFRDPNSRTTMGPRRSEWRKYSIKWTKIREKSIFSMSPIQLMINFQTLGLSCTFSRKKPFATAFNVINCLKQIKYQRLLYACSPIICFTHK